MESYKDKVLLITGGTGSFGNAVLKKYLNSDIGEIRIFSRDEKKQDEMRSEYKNDKIKYYIGDVRHYESIDQAMVGVDYYSSTTDSFKIFDIPTQNFLPYTSLYFDDIQDLDDNYYTGEYLALKEYNMTNNMKKIQQINKLRYHRIFKNQLWVEQMFWFINFNNQFFRESSHKWGKPQLLDNPYF